MGSDTSRLLIPSRFQAIIAYAVLCIMSIIAVLPMIWMILTSLKDPHQLFPANGAAAPNLLSSLIPRPFAWHNYPDALHAVHLRDYLRNSLFLCISTVIGTLLSSTVVAYGFAKHSFAGKNVLFLLMISTLAIPSQVTMIPLFDMFQRLGWYDTFLPLIIPAYFGAPFFIFLLTQFFQTIPSQLIEAARIDGLPEWKILVKVVLPLAKPALATVALFQFIWTWNDFFGPLLYLNSPSKFTLAYGLQEFLSKNGGEWNLLMAGAAMFTLPIIVLFFFAQKTFIQGIATTGGKN